ncbi:hypothetical protein FTO74_02670 [Granulicella sp. WH15]|nr:hypothetical protein FTO74_02670 [Granulicella sp. WH15]
MLLSFGFAAQAQLQTHTADAPQILEGPQAPGVAPPPPADSGPAVMNNDSVLKMFHAGLGDDLIVQTIGTQPGAYDTDSDNLVKLKQAGLSDPILKAMIAANRRLLTPGSKPPVVRVSEVSEPGLYYKDRNGQWVPMDSETVHVVSGGFIKSTVTNGIIKPDRNGRVYGRESKLVLARPIEFLICTPEGVTASEYDLILFRLNSKDREFRTLTGGVIHSTGGAKRDEMPFSPVQTAPHTYTFTLDQKTPGGEYGILPPGTGNVTNGGKIYTFAIVE